MSIGWLQASFGVLAFLYVAKKTTKSWAALMISTLAKYVNKKIHQEKTTLFEPLTALSKEMKQKGKVCRVLELGGGSGTNFQFVKSPVEWTVTEPNVKFAPYFKDTVAKLGGEHDIKELVEASGEDLGKFEPDSFDAVVLSLVLCTVGKQEDVLKEVLRVLKPGGKFYFIEHVGASKGTTLRTIQDVLSDTGIWANLTDGCYLNRDTEISLKKAGFSKVDLVNYQAPYASMWLFSTQMYGWATK